MNLRKQVYLDIVTQLKTHAATTGKIVWFDLWNNQVERFSGENPFPFPAVFIDFGTIVWFEDNGGWQRGDCTIKVIVLQEDFAESYDESTSAGTALRLLDLPELIFQALQNFAGTNFNRLVRVQDEADVDHDHVRVDTVSFNCTVWDGSLAPENQYTDHMVENLEVIPDNTIYLES